MNIQPRVTISITCFGRPERTKRAIECILRQDINGWEAFIMGDCCPDFQKLIDSGYLENIKQEQEKKGNIIHYFNAKTNGGGCGYTLINHALQTASGKYFLFYSNDDIILPNHMSNYLEIENQPELDFMYFNTWVDPRNSIRDTKLVGGSIGHSEIIVKTELAKRITPHNPNYGHDWDFIEEMSRLGNGSKSISENLTYKVMSITNFGKIITNETID